MSEKGEGVGRKGIACIQFQTFYQTPFTHERGAIVQFRAGLAFTTPAVRDICTFAVLFSVSRPFFAPHVFMRGTLCCVISKDFKQSEVVRQRICAFLEAISLPLLSACRFAELGTSF